MKKFSVKSYVAGMLTMVILFSSTLAFAETRQTIEAIFGRVKLVVDGKAVDKETLLYNGTTYVPLRAAAEALGKEVSYNDTTKTAYIGAVPTEISSKPATVKYYAEFLDVPDFEKTVTLSSESSFLYDETKDGKKTYIYALANSDKQAMTDYRNFLTNNGFEKMYENIGSVTFRKNNVLVITEENRSYFHITVSQNNHNVSAKSQNQFYSEFPEVPNFAYIIGISDGDALREVMIDDIEFKYSWLYIPKNSMELYIEELTRCGFSFYRETSGIKMYYNNNCFVGLTINNEYFSVSISAM